MAYALRATNKARVREVYWMRRRMRWRGRRDKNGEPREAVVV